MWEMRTEIRMWSLCWQHNDDDHDNDGDDDGDCDSDDDDDEEEEEDEDEDEDEEDEDEDEDEEDEDEDDEEEEDEDNADTLEFSTCYNYTCQGPSAFLHYDVVTECDLLAHLESTFEVLRVWSKSWRRACGCTFGFYGVYIFVANQHATSSIIHSHSIEQFQEQGDDSTAGLCCTFCGALHTTHRGCGGQGVVKCIGHPSLSSRLYNWNLGHARPSMISKTEYKPGQLAFHCVFLIKCFWSCSQASDLNINGLMALSPKAGWFNEKTGSTRVVPTESCCSRVRRSHCPIST